MAKMVVIYRRPAEPAAFDRHYRDVHVPLAKQLPGLIRYEVSRGPVVGRFAGEAPYLVGTLTFASMQAIREAFATDLGRQCAEDRKILAPADDDSTMYLFDDEPV